MDGVVEHFGTVRSDLALRVEYLNHSVSLGTHVSAVRLLDEFRKIAGW